MNIGNVVVYIIVGWLGLAAAALGFAAEATKVEVTEVAIGRFGKCVYPSSPASPLAYVAAMLTLIAAVVISATARCGCCLRNNPSKTSQSSAVGVFFFVFSWVATVIGMTLLITGASLNNYQDNKSNYYSRCYVVKPGVLAAGAVLALVSCIFGLTAFTCVSGYSQNALAANQPGIAMGQPHRATFVGNNDPSYNDNTGQEQQQQHV